MIILGRAILGVAKVLDWSIGLYKWVVLAAVLVSWTRPDPNHPLVRLVLQLTDPVFSWIRRRLPASLFATGLDFTPIVVFLVLIFLQTFVAGSLIDISYRLIYDRPELNSAVFN